MSSTSTNNQGLSAFQITQFGGIAFAVACIWAANSNWFGFALPNTIFTIYQNLFDAYSGVFGTAIAIFSVSYVIAAWVDQLEMSVFCGVATAVTVAASYVVPNQEATVTLTTWAIAIGVSAVVMAGVAAFAAYDVKKMKGQEAIKNDAAVLARNDIEVTESFSAN